VTFSGFEDDLFGNTGRRADAMLTCTAVRRSVSAG
jgi:hypothetical protein